MVCLNPNHPETDTPQAIRDWLDLFYQSIHSPHKPNINLNNAGIKRAADLMDYTKLSPVQLREAKEKEQGEIVKSIYMAEGRQEGIKEGELKRNIEIAEKLILKGVLNEAIAELTGLNDEEIERLRSKN